MATVAHNNHNAKLVLLGDMGAGKSSLVLRFVKGQFLEFQESTIGAAFFSQTLAVNDATVKFEIWDTAGQERYHSLAPMYYRGAAAAIIVYDITNTESFTRAKKWIQELQKQGNPNMVMALAGNKADLEERRSVPSEEGRAYAEENSLFFVETSAKTAQNVNEIFYELGPFEVLPANPRILWERELSILKDFTQTLEDYRLNKKTTKGSTSAESSRNGSSRSADRRIQSFNMLFIGIPYHLFPVCCRHE